MFRLNLVLRTKKDSLILAPALWFRFVFLLFAGIILWGIFIVSSDLNHRSLIIPGIISGICFIASLYEETWRFDKKNKVVFSKNGIAFIFRQKSYEFSEISNIEYNTFLRGREFDDEKGSKKINPFSKENTAEAQGKRRIIHKKYHQELKLNLVSGESIIIESLDTRNTDALLETAKQISAFTGIDRSF